eukprot:6480349-Amphidinium_carterae.1
MAAKRVNELDLVEDTHTHRAVACLLLCATAGNKHAQTCCCLGSSCEYVEPWQGALSWPHDPCVHADAHDSVHTFIQGAYVRAVQALFTAQFHQSFLSSTLYS